MATFQVIISRLVTLFLLPFQSLDPIWPLLSLSLVMTMSFLFVFRHATDPVKVRTVKNRVQAHLLELRLFKDSPRILFSALGNILIHNGRYLRLSLRPLALLLFPIALLLVHLEGWFGYRPLHPAEAAVVTVKVGPDRLVGEATLEVSPGLILETPSLWVPALGEISWTIRGKKAGSHRVVVQGLSRASAKRVVVSDKTWFRVWPTTISTGFWNHFWNPGEAVLDPQGQVQQITLNYPARTIRLLGWKMHWLINFFLASCLFGWVASRWMKVVI
jgi:hypothetical protein